MNNLEEELSFVFKIDLLVFWVEHTGPNTADQTNKLQLDKLALFLDFLSWGDFWLAWNKAANISLQEGLFQKEAVLAAPFRLEWVSYFLCRGCCLF